MYSKSINAIVCAVRSLFSNRRSLLLIVAVYTGLLAAIYLFVSTREATISQLLLTLITVIAAPALFFVLQAIIVVPTSRNLMKNSLKLIAVSVPVIALTLVAVYGLNKLETHPTIVTTMRYLLLAVIGPLLVVQLWIAAGNGIRVRNVLTRTFAPQSVFVYALGFLIFAVVPYLLLHKTVTLQRPWLELSLMILRLGLSALLILFGWVLTVRTLSILSTKRA